MLLLYQNCLFIIAALLKGILVFVNLHITYLRVEESYRSPSPYSPGERLLAPNSGDKLDISLLPEHRLTSSHNRTVHGCLPSDRIVPGVSSLSTGSSLLGNLFFFYFNVFKYLFFSLYLKNSNFAT